jgi:hypothetical protein
VEVHAAARGGGLELHDERAHVVVGGHGLAEAGDRRVEGLVGAASRYETSVLSAWATEAWVCATLPASAALSSRFGARRRNQ